MAAYHQTPLATAIPIPAPEAAGEYSLSRTSTDVDESMVKALRGQGFTRGKSTVLDTHRLRGSADQIFLVLNQSLMPACSVLNIHQAWPSRWRRTMRHSL